MTPDYAALAQRLRDRAAYYRRTCNGTCKPDISAEDSYASLDLSFDNLALDMDSAASALDRLAAVEGALRGLDSATRAFLAGMVKVKKREADKAFYAEDLERCCNALATARRALEGDKS